MVIVTQHEREIYVPFVFQCFLVSNSSLFIDVLLKVIDKNLNEHRETNSKVNKCIQLLRARVEHAEKSH